MANGARTLCKYAIVLYQCAISPFKRPCCRFYPTCSSYALEAIQKFGVMRGSWLSLMRMLRCQPFCESGVDFIPDEFVWFPARNPVDYQGCPHHTTPREG
ncbi:MAG: membrane protein insertion efficiency factor YidD [Gammaproteobacteria bacterium]|nr:membrane protein insertion efficiency factor YidD [Gammaproteobacteria bacterium]